MESMYQRSKIQEESLYYEQLKDSGELPIIGINTFLSDDHVEEEEIEFSRSSDDENKIKLPDLITLKKKINLSQRML